MANNHWRTMSYCSFGTGSSYILPLEGFGKHFDPISWVATQEIGESGPLNVDKLREFLEFDSDRRIKSILATIREYTDNVRGFYEQLKELKDRITQIEEEENQLTRHVTNQITVIIEGLQNARQISAVDCQLRLSSAVDEALRYIGSRPQAPLNREGLLDFIHTGRHNEHIPRPDLLRQLNGLYDRIRSESNREKHRLSLPVSRIEKAMNDIVKENMGSGANVIPS